jgi:hypothetical protein
MTIGPGRMAQAFNTSYSGGRELQICGFGPALDKNL